MTERELLIRAKALTILIDVSCPKRLRNSEYVRHLVKPRSPTEALVKEHKVIVEIQDRGDNLPKVEHFCECRDWGKQGACKHVLAFAYNLLKGLHLLWEETRSRK